MKFLVLYQAPAAGIEEWLKLPEDVRKKQEADLKGKWDVWMNEHASMHTGPVAGAGATKRVTSAGVTDTKNDVMLYAIVEGETHETVAKAFEGHPHLEIPGATIDIMPSSALPGMEG